MREIKFRGKRKGGNEWLIGDLNHIDGKTYIFDRSQNAPLNSSDWFEVDPKTVGQYTGLKDKLSQELFDGDMVEFLYKNPESTEKLRPVRCVIVWHDDGAWCLQWQDGYKNAARLNQEKYTKVGNIHEHPDLLK